METSDAKTIDDFRNEITQSCKFFEANDLHPCGAYWEIADTVMRSLAETGSAVLFAEVEDAVRNMILRDLRQYRRSGVRERCNAHAGIYIDGRPEGRAAIATLASAGIVSQTMLKIAEPIPRFKGLELIHGIGLLSERLACDDALLDVGLVALAKEVPNLGTHPQNWTMSLQITEHERQNIDNLRYYRVPVRSCVATFALRKRVSMYFWPRFSFDEVWRFHVKQEPRPRGQTELKVNLTMIGKGRVWCREMELLRLEEIKLASES